MTEQALPTDLHAESFFTADYAVVENGKLYISGGAWNRIGHPSFPAVQAFAVAAILHIPWRAHGQNHGFVIWFEDADGQNIAGRVEGSFQAAVPPGALPGDYSVAPVAVNINAFVFQRPGDYAAVLSLDGTEISRWRFRVAQTFGIPGAPTLPVAGGVSPPMDPTPDAPAE
ncbi:MAG TPA: hypothetical protein VMU94_05745 [Streptosporangiaceae bacterium]|nr:hypothetical protein [Streptosporangiaceae bacterium]